MKRRHTKITLLIIALNIIEIETPRQKPAKNTEDLQAALQDMIARGRKEGMVPMSDLNALLDALHNLKK